MEVHYSRQLSAKQKEMLVNFIYARPDMYKGKLSATYTNAVSVTLWKEVTNILNAIPGGATKDWKQWRKTWIDIKKNVKSRISKQKRYTTGTGGGPPLPPPELETSDEKILHIITPVAIQGNEDIPESQIVFEDVTEEFEDPSLVVNVGEDTNKNNETNYMEQEVDAMQSEIVEDIQDQDHRLDHNYHSSEANKRGAVNRNKNEGIRKRYTKSARLTDSIKNNKKFLEVSQKGIERTETYREKKLELIKKHNESMNNYYQKKIAALETKEIYHQRKINILAEISDAINKIATSY